MNNKLCKTLLLTLLALPFAMVHGQSLQKMHYVGESQNVLSHSDQPYEYVHLGNPKENPGGNDVQYYWKFEDEMSKGRNLRTDFVSESNVVSPNEAKKPQPKIRLASDDGNGTFVFSCARVSKYGSQVEYQSVILIDHVVVRISLDKKCWTNGTKIKIEDFIVSTVPKGYEDKVDVLESTSVAWIPEGENKGEMDVYFTFEDDDLDVVQTIDVRDDSQGIELTGSVNAGPGVLSYGNSVNAQNLVKVGLCVKNYRTQITKLKELTDIVNVACPKVSGRFKLKLNGGLNNIDVHMHHACCDKEAADYLSFKGEIFVDAYIFAAFPIYPPAVELVIGLRGGVKEKLDDVIIGGCDPPMLTVSYFFQAEGGLRAKLVDPDLCSLTASLVGGWEGVSTVSPGSIKYKTGRRYLKVNVVGVLIFGKFTWTYTIIDDKL